MIDVMALAGTAFDDDRRELFRAQEALRRIINARDFGAEHSIYPEAPDGPDKHQAFDDWAANVAEEALP